MKLRKLARLCEHDEIHRHNKYNKKGLFAGVCPGGVFLAEGARIFSAEMVASWRFCPRCGRPNVDQPREVGVDQCLPSNCDLWVHESTFNHKTRQWEPLASQVGESE